VEVGDGSEHALPPLLTSRAVAKRYGCDVKAARRIMREAGALAAGRRLLIRVDTLDLWERENTRRSADASTTASRSRTRFRHVDPGRLTDLREDWWKDRA
jgi:hypothetical protein